mmetsp:Transcript_32142/g.84146  ORF Transcript_32142/g.84146 Transcript_32142/m.84146 type:complete len:441 (+) Transcript_32142:399-1721(+)
MRISTSASGAVMPHFAQASSSCSKNRPISRKVLDACSKSPSSSSLMRSSCTSAADRFDSDGTWFAMGSRSSSAPPARSSRLAYMAPDGPPAVSMALRHRRAWNSGPIVGWSKVVAAFRRSSPISLAPSPALTLAVVISSCVWMGIRRTPVGGSISIKREQSPARAGLVQPKLGGGKGPPAISDGLRPGPFGRRPDHDGRRPVPFPRTIRDPRCAEHGVFVRLAFRADAARRRASMRAITGLWNAFLAGDDRFDAGERRGDRMDGDDALANSPRAAGDRAAGGRFAAGDNPRIGLGDRSDGRTLGVLRDGVQRGEARADRGCTGLPSVRRAPHRSGDCGMPHAAAPLLDGDSTRVSGLVGRVWGGRASGEPGGPPVVAGGGDGLKWSRCGGVGGAVAESGSGASPAGRRDPTLGEGLGLAVAPASAPLCSMFSSSLPRGER